jgi:hypothetical protein
VTSSTTLQYFFAKTIHPQEKTASAVAASQEHARRLKLAHATLEENVNSVYHVSYAEFLVHHKRWLVNDETDRNRDADMARRGLKRLDKWWDEGDETLLMASKDAVDVGPEGLD